MQKGKLSIVTSSAAIAVGLAIEVDPAIWYKFVGVGAPEVRGAVDGPRTEDDLGSCGDVLAQDCGWVDGVTNGDWTG
jgi:hypothetical protein